MPRAIRGAVVTAVGCVALAWSRWGACRVVVEGASMEPSLAAGDRLLVVRRLLAAPRPVVGDLVVFHDPDEPDRLLVKRVAVLAGPSVEVLGDNSDASRDSRRFGPIPLTGIIGRPWYRYAPANATGRLPRPPRPPR